MHQSKGDSKANTRQDDRPAPPERGQLTHYDSCLDSLLFNRRHVSPIRGPDDEQQQTSLGYEIALRGIQHPEFPASAHYTPGFRNRETRCACRPPTKCKKDEYHPPPEQVRSQAGKIDLLEVEGGRIERKRHEMEEKSEIRCCRHAVLLEPKAQRHTHQHE